MVLPASSCHPVSQCQRRREALITYGARLGDARLLGDRPAPGFERDEMRKLSVVLPTKNEEKSIGPLLQSIFDQEYDGEIQVLIMDSSNDRTVEIARTFPLETVRVETADYNYGKSRNDGAAATDGDILVFISADVEIADKQWLTALVGHFSDPDVAGVYGRQVPKATASPIEQFFILHTYEAESRVVSLESGNQNFGMVFFSNTNSAIRRSV